MREIVTAIVTDIVTTIVNDIVTAILNDILNPIVKKAALLLLLGSIFLLLDIDYN